MVSEIWIGFVEFLLLLSAADFSGLKFVWRRRTNLINGFSKILVNWNCSLSLLCAGMENSC